MKITFAAVAVSLMVGLSGSAADAASLIVNGNFSLGDDFNSGSGAPGTDYTTANAGIGTHTNPPSYNIIQNPAVNFTNGYTSYTDHTGDLAANMLFVDGATGLRFWYESPTLAAGTTYMFSYFATGADNENYADIQVSLNGVAIDTGNTLTTTGQWVEYTNTFTTTAAGAYAISMADLNNIQEGNDFTVDDIALTASATPLPAALPLFAGGLGMLGMFARRKKQRAEKASAAA